MFRFIQMFVVLSVAALLYWYLWLPSSAAYYTVAEQRLTRDYIGPALLNATRQVVVTARSQGFLSEVHADRNDSVTKGQILAVLDVSELKYQYASALATKQAMDESIEEAEIELDRASLALTQAEAGKNRQMTLLQQKTITQVAFNSAESEFKQAAANVAKAKVAIKRAMAQAQSAAADLELLSTRMAETHILSPIDGVVLSRSRSAGDLLTPGAELLQLVDPTSILVSARFDETAMSSVREGQTASARFSSQPNERFTGKLIRISRQVDPETREFTADIVLDTLPLGWALGQRAMVTLSVASPSPVVAVPQYLISRADGQAGVWINHKGRALWTQISLGNVSGDKIEITQGLSVGDNVLDPNNRYNYEPVTLAKRLP
jgi:HlyD family secretion protein